MSTTSSTSSTSSIASASSLQSQFMNLLVTQLKNQDPTDPMDDNQMTAELAQFLTAGADGEFEFAVFGRTFNYSEKLCQLISGQDGYI